MRKAALITDYGPKLLGKVPAEGHVRGPGSTFLTVSQEMPMWPSTYFEGHQTGGKQGGSENVKRVAIKE